MIVKTNRLIWADSLKGAAILLVVLGHMLPMSPFKSWIYTFHIPLFFFLSGYLLHINRRWQVWNWRELFVRKASSLLYPYLTFSILTIVFQLLQRQLDSALLSVVFAVLLFGIQTLWFLPALFFAELFTIVSIKRFPRVYYAVLPCALVVSAGICMVFSPVSNASLVQKVIQNEIIFLNRILLGSVFLWFGYYFAKIEHRIPTGTMTLLPAAVLLGVNLACFRLNTFVDLCSGQIGNPIWYYLNGISGVLAVFLIIRAVGDSFRLLPFLGQNSLIIFATHQNFRIIELGKNHLPLPIAFLAVIAAEILVVTLVNRWLPCLLSPNWLKKHSPQAAHE